MKIRLVLICAFLTTSALLVGCKRDIESEAAVRQGVMNYLAKRSDLTQMDVTVTKVSFKENEADATVHFQAKGTNAPGSGLEMNYVLDRKGNEWVVRGRGTGMGHGAGMGSGENPHGGAMPGGMPGAMPGGTGALPPGHPAMPQGQMPPGAMPSGHSTLPPGHPAIPPSPPGQSK